MIPATEIQEIANYVKEKGISEEVVSELRNKYRGKHFTYCMDDDINVGKPVVLENNFALYLVDSREHCSILTNDPDIASGYVLAEIIED